MLTMQITEAQSKAMDALVKLGFGLSNTYGDGVVRMVTVERVGVFVRADGSISEPHTTATQIVSAALRSAGLR